MMAAVLFVPVSFAADASESLQVQTDAKVIYCTAQLAVEGEMFQQPLQDGIAVATEWRVKVGKVREYWLNDNIGDITVIRRVEPDLLTRSWLLIDHSSGISHRVYSIDSAIAFLTSLNHFPVLDRSLLLVKTPYRVGVNVNIHIGDANDAWWSGLWPSTAAKMQKEFTLQ